MYIFTLTLMLAVLYTTDGDKSTRNNIARQKYGHTNKVE
jgi:hypothetical protein